MCQLSTVFHSNSEKMAHCSVQELHRLGKQDEGQADNHLVLWLFVLPICYCILSPKLLLSQQLFPWRACNTFLTSTRPKTSWTSLFLLSVELNPSLASTKPLKPLIRPAMAVAKARTTKTTSRIKGQFLGMFVRCLFYHATR